MGSRGDSPHHLLLDRVGTAPDPLGEVWAPFEGEKGEKGDRVKSTVEKGKERKSTFVMARDLPLTNVNLHYVPLFPPLRPPFPRAMALVVRRGVPAPSAELVLATGTA